MKDDYDEYLTVDLLFLVDITNSMNKWLKMAYESIDRIVESFKQRYAG